MDDFRVYSYRILRISYSIMPRAIMLQELRSI